MPPRPDTLADSLVARARTLFRADLERSTARARELGEVLEQLAARVGRRYGATLKTRVCIPKSSAQRYRDVFRLGVEDPAFLVRHAAIGPTRLARLYRVRPDAREHFAAGGESAACAIDAPEFDAATRPFLRDPPPTRRAPDRTAELRRHLQTVTRLLRAAAADPPRPADRATRQGLLADLSAVCRAATAVSGRIRPGIPARPPAPPQPAVSEPRTPPPLPSPVTAVAPTVSATTGTRPPSIARPAPSPRPTPPAPSRRAPRPTATTRTDVPVRDRRARARKKR